MALPQEITVESIGLTVLNPELPPDQALVDIIFVHGLGGHPQRTWTYKGPKRDPVSDESEDDVVHRLPTNEGEGTNEADPNSAHSTETSEMTRQMGAIEVQGDELDQEERTKRSLLKRLKTSINHLSPSSSRKASQKDSATKVLAKPNVFFWPQKLPKACERARVMTFGYDSDVSKFFGGAANQNTFYDHAEDLLGWLDRKRTRAQDRPIVFVAHSLGGLVVKQMLFKAKQSEAFPERRNIYSSTKALFFLGTPHRGSDWAAWGEIVRGFAGIIFDTNRSLIKDLAVNGQPLKQLEENFAQLLYLRTFWVYTFIEAKHFKPLRFLNSKIVNDNYATIGDPGRERIFTINANHTAMCRFWGRKDPGYEIVAGELQNFVDQSIVQGEVDASLRKQTEEKLRQEALLNSLDYPGRRDREDRLWQIEAKSETVQWIWGSTFADWTSEAGGLFWICGKPASGKSTLMDYISRCGEIQDRLKRGINAKWTIVHHFFFDFGVRKDVRNNFEGFLRSLLYQLGSESGGMKENLDLGGLNLSRNELKQWSIRELKEQLTGVLEQYSNPICLLLDGLDEYQGNKWDLAAFLLEISSPRIKLCVASRPDAAFNIVFKDLPNIKMQDWNTPAIDKLVKMTIKSSVANSGFYNDEKIVQLAKDISQKAQGVFLWARFAINELRDGWSKGFDVIELQKILEEVPKELDNIYARISGKLEPKLKQEAAYMLQLVCYAKETLTLDELYVALTHASCGQGPLFQQTGAHNMQQFERRIFAATGGVLEIFRGRDMHETQELDRSQSQASQTDEKFVNIIHRTVRTHLDSTGWSQILGEAHHGILHAEVLWLRVCAQIFSPSPKEVPKVKNNDLMLRGFRAPLDPCSLSSSEPEVSSTDPLGLSPCSGLANESSPLLKYAALYMLDHATEVERLGLSSYDMLQSIMSNRFFSYHRHYWKSSEGMGYEPCVFGQRLIAVPKPTHSVHMAIAHGLAGYVKDFLSILRKKASPGNREWDDVVDLEVDEEFSYGGRTASPENFRMSLLGFALHHANSYRQTLALQTSVVALLLDHYSCVHDVEMIIALQHCPAEVVHLLLLRWPDGKMVLRSNVLRSDGYLKREVSSYGLLEFCPEIFDFGPMWHIAMRMRLVFTIPARELAELVDLFVRRGEDINGQCGPFGTALHGVLLQLGPSLSSVDPLKILVTKGADVNAGGPLGTPLEFVWRLANTAIIHLDFRLLAYTHRIYWLIENGAENKKCDPNGSVPSKERMLAFGRSGMEGFRESQRLYRGDPPDDENSADGISAVA